MKDPLIHSSDVEFLTSINQLLMKDKPIEILLQELLDSTCHHLSNELGLFVMTDKNQDQARYIFPTFLQNGKTEPTSSINQNILTDAVKLGDQATIQKLFKVTSKEFYCKTLIENEKMQLVFIIGVSKTQYELLDHVSSQVQLVLHKHEETNKQQQTIVMQNYTFASNRKLSQGALEGKNIREICELLSEIIQLPVCLVDSFLYERYTSNVFSELSQFLDSTYFYDTLFTHCELTIEENIGIFPIKKKREILGFFLVQLDGEHISDFTQINIEHGLNLIALQLIKEHELIDTKKQLAGEILKEYMSSKKKREFAKKLDALGVNNNIPCYHISLTKVEEESLDKALNIIYIESTSLTYMPMLTPTGVVFFTKFGREEMERFVKNIVRLLVQYEIAPSIMVGRKVNNIFDIDTSFKDTENMVNRVINKDARIQFFDDMFIENLLIDIPIDKANDYIYKKLGTLTKKDSREQILFKTLIVYLNSDLNHKESCKKLNIHINTLYYRLNTLKNEYDIDLSNYEEVFAIQLALRLKDLIK
ncbi:PucR family transcriptional regulator [Virgibacillus byunsanensis]|uniref:PucR family transcriptional regulator n=1 Tax=Virgibacillus byunsanensis TaxID=570945 RepID=A0ABW3LIF5_9BACI